MYHRPPPNLTPPSWRRPALPLVETCPLKAAETSDLQACYAVLPPGSVLSEAVFRELVGRREDTEYWPEEGVEAA